MTRLAILILNSTAVADARAEAGVFAARKRIESHAASLVVHGLTIDHLIEVGFDQGARCDQSLSEFSITQAVTFTEAISLLSDYTGHCLVTSPAMAETISAWLLPFAEMADVSDCDISVLSTHGEANDGWRIERDQKGRFRQISRFGKDGQRAEAAESIAACLIITRRCLREFTQLALEETWEGLFHAISQMAAAGWRIGTNHFASFLSADGADQPGICSVCQSDFTVSAATGILLERESAILAVDDPGFNSGQLTIFPKRHLSCFLSLRDNEKRDISELIQIGEQALKKIYLYDALNLGFNSGDGAHLQVRMIPRWVGDLNFMPLVSGLKPVPDSPLSAWSRLHEVIR